MLFRGRTISEIEENDLLSLIDTVDEGTEVDFKESAYPSPPDAQLLKDQRDRDRVKNQWKLDLCTDVSAFANASGGWIICGMEEEGGTATKLCGLGTSIDGEREVARLEQCIMSGTQPTIQGLRIKAINLSDATKSKAIVIYIPRSYSAPHRVRETSKFYIRRSNRNYEMNVDELRAAFNLSNTLSDRIKRLREERANAISADDEHEAVPVILEPGIRLVLHVIPLAFADISSSVNLKSLEFLETAFPDHAIQRAFVNGLRYGFDGLVLALNYREGQTREYFQIFRSGAVEYVEVLRSDDPEGGTFISPYRVENQTLVNLKIALRMQRNLGVQPPLIIMLSLLGTRGSKLRFQNDFIDARPPKINRDMILIPDVIVEDYDQDLRTLMRRVFDILWNTGGYDGSPSYDEQTGEWIRTSR